MAQVTATLAGASKKLTFEQYLLLPYDGRRTEFVDGEIIEMTEPSPLHIDIIEILGDLLKAYFRDHKLELVVKSGPGVQIPQVGRSDSSRDPDLVVCTKAQWAAMVNQTKALFLCDNASLLVLEVVSPDTVKTDTQDKRADYADAKVPEYWVVNPVDSYVSVWVLDGRIYIQKGEYRGQQKVESEVLEKWRTTAEEMLG
ncbi:MAG: Uma2 family endonuclease [Cyanobacteria bacterium J06659_2]